MSSPYLCQQDNSILVVVDIQKRLAAAMAEGCLEKMTTNVVRLLHAAELLDIPVVALEQYPDGLGHLLPAVSEALPPVTEVVEKTSFSACGTEDFMDVIRLTGRNQAVVCGLEAHVCVLQTAMDLHQLGFRTFVVENAVCSRSQHNLEISMRRMREAGITITVSESVIFEWLGNKNHPRFSDMLQLVR